MSNEKIICGNIDIKAYQCKYKNCDHTKGVMSAFCPHHGTLQYLDLRHGLELPKEHYEGMNMTYVENPDKEW